VCTDPLYYLTWAGIGNLKAFRGSPEEVQAVSDLVSRIVRFAKSQGVSQVYFYGVDEASGEGLRIQRPAWKAVHEAGGKMFVAGYVGHFEVIGDLLDVLVCAGHPNIEEANLFHSAGHRIFCYGNPQGGVEDPEIYRRNYGLLLWKNNYDGAYTFAYQLAYGTIWNDFNNPKYRNHNFTYPTVDGVIDTVQWEGYREAVDDVRYVTTLLNAIEEGKQSANREITAIALGAQQYLAELDVRKADLNVVRLEMVNYILRLKGQPGGVLE